MISAIFLLGFVLGCTILGFKQIRSVVVRFLFLTHSIGVIAMLAVPAIWHAIAGYDSIGFLGIAYDANTVERTVYRPLLAVAYVFSLTTFGIVLVSRPIGAQFRNLEPQLGAPAKPRYLMIYILLALCVAFFLQFYGSVDSILMMRARESVTLPIYVELLRGAVIASCTYATIVLATTRILRHPIPFFLALALFLFSLSLMVGFGSRNLLVYPIAAIILMLWLRRDRALLRRNMLLGFGLLALFVSLALVQSNIRDSGFALGHATTLDLSRMFWAFDHFNALYVAFETAGDFIRPDERMPLSIITDVMLYFIPRSWFEILELEKTVSANYLAWNVMVTGTNQINIAPSHIGQAWIEDGLQGLILLPVSMTILVSILTNVIAFQSRHDENPLDHLALIALCAGTLFNLVRMASGFYMLYFFVFACLVFTVRVISAVVTKRDAKL